MVLSRKSELVTTGATAAAKVAIYKWARELVTWLEKGRAAAKVGPAADTPRLTTSQSLRAPVG